MALPHAGGPGKAGAAGLLRNHQNAHGLDHHQEKARRAAVQNCQGMHHRLRPNVPKLLHLQ